MADKAAHQQQTKGKSQWYLLRYPGGKWAAFQLPTLAFLESYSDHCEWRGPFKTRAEAMAALAALEDTHP